MSINLLDEPQVEVDLGLKLVVKGKTKRVYLLPRSQKHGQLVLVQLTDVITSLDGERRSILPGKGAAAVRATVAVFKRMKAMGHKSHYVDLADLEGGYLDLPLERNDDHPEIDGLQMTVRDLATRPDVFIAKKLDMSPREFVIRIIGWGSLLKRYPRLQAGIRLAAPAGEVYVKNDALHDPLEIIDVIGGRVLLFKSGVPMSEGFLSETDLPQGEGHPTAFQLMQQHARILACASDVFMSLHTPLKAAGHILVDCKFEAGVDENGETYIGDEVTPDSFRLWEDGDPKKPLDKDPFRKCSDFEIPEVLPQVLRNYEKAAALIEGLPEVTEEEKGAAPSGAWVHQ